MVKDNYFQGLRGLAILSVVIIHTLPIMGNKELTTVVRQIINFAVPLFIFISGYFARKQYEKIGGDTYIRP